MDDLPTPKLRAGWVSALFLALFFFFIYYVFMFDALLRAYKSQFYEVSFLNNSTINVLAYFPKNFFSSGEEWVFINLQNNSNENLYDIQVYLKVSSSDDLVVLLPAIYGEKGAAADGGYNAINFEIIQPYSTSVDRMPVLVQYTTVIEGVFVKWIDEKGQPHSAELLPEQTIHLGNAKGELEVFIQNSRALKHVFLEVVLLPPWSNGLLFALVLFSTYLVRDNIEKKTDTLPSDSGWWKEVSSIFVDSLGSLASMVGVIILLLALDILALPPVVGCILIYRLFLIRRNGQMERFKDQLDFWSFILFAISIVWFFFDKHESLSSNISWAMLGLISLGAFLWSRKQSFSRFKSNAQAEIQDLSKKKTRNR